MNQKVSIKHSSKHDNHKDFIYFYRVCGQQYFEHFLV